MPERKPMSANTSQAPGKSKQMGAGEKAWETRLKNKEKRSAAAKKAWEIRRKNEAKEKRSAAAKKAWATIYANQCDPKKIEYLERRQTAAKPDVCVVCGDNRVKVLQIHHADREKKIEIMLCANCHDLVRRGTLQDLKLAHKLGCPTK